MKRAAAVMFCSALVVMLGLVFTRVIAARVPQQRATLEKLIADRTGLSVRFDNVRFAWNLDGASAVFTRVELTDPAAGRVRVVAPELRVELDTWDFLRHQQFSFGHVTLSSPDIDIIGDADGTVIGTLAANGARVARGKPAIEDEATLLRRQLAWAELMPPGRIEVEGARVHLVRRGERVARHSFTLSQAVVSRGPGTFNAWGTMLLAQDVGQSLFVSAKLDGLRAGERVSGEMRFIARRVFLDRLPVAGLNGRGTLDATVRLRDGRVETAHWQGTAREVQVAAPFPDGARFDHITANGKLARVAGDLRLEFSDLQFTRGAELQRAHGVEARLRLASNAVRVEQFSAHADKVPFLAAQFFAGLIQARDPAAAAHAGAWTPLAGEFTQVRFESGAHGEWSLDARLGAGEARRNADQARLAGLAGEVHRDARGYSLRFDPGSPVRLVLSPETPARTLALSGSLLVDPAAGPAAWSFGDFGLASGAGVVRIAGRWQPGPTRAEPLKLELAQLDHALLQDARQLLASSGEVPGWARDIEHASIVTGHIELLPQPDGTINWRRSSGTLRFEQLATRGERSAQLAAGRGSLDFARGGLRLALDGGSVQDLAIRDARVDWPRGGAPRLQATLEGGLDSALLRETLNGNGLGRLRGAVELVAEARGERALRDPQLWRVTAHLRDASVPLAAGLPPVEKLAGTLRYSGRQLRGVDLDGQWFGGPVAIESRRNARNVPSLAMNGVADAAPLLELTGGAEAAQRVTGKFAWNGSADYQPADRSWLLSVASNLSGIESRLPEPFDKPRARSLPVSAQINLAPEGIRSFVVDGGRALDVRGEVRDGATTARFEVQGVSGELRRDGRHANPTLRIDELDIRRAPLLLAASGALLPVDGELVVDVGTLRSGNASAGVLRASVARDASGMSFWFDTPATTVHQLSAHGRCELETRCRAEFSADTDNLAALLRGVRLPEEWPTASLHAAGALDWPVDPGDSFAGTLAGSFTLAMQGEAAEHQLSAHATVAHGEIQLTEVQGTGPAADQMFRGEGRIGLLANDYDVTVDYEPIALAATGVPSTTRAKLARAWNAMRGSAARRGWAEAAPTARRVQWHGTWD
ncbi:MAG TPA: hypothetical protein VFL16_00390 [Steroidobacteraceae bacterium]|nr:hypothetical protein [Steroidobacteraceae bacterium]